MPIVGGKENNSDCSEVQGYRPWQVPTINLKENYLLIFYSKLICSRLARNVEEHLNTHNALPATPEVTCLCTAYYTLGYCLEYI